MPGGLCRRPFREAAVIPLTVDCARVRQLLPDLLDEPVPPVPAIPDELTEVPAVAAPPSSGMISAEDRAFAEAHLAGCVGCQEARKGITQALAALEHLTPDDVMRLRALADGELDSRPLARLAAACIAAILVVVVGVTVATAPLPTAPVRAPMAPSIVDLDAQAYAQVAVGAELGIEDDPELHRAPIELPSFDDAELARDARNDGVDEPATEEAAVDDPAVVAVVAHPDPVVAAAGPAAGEPAPRADQVDAPAPPPAELLALFARLELSDGVGYRDVTIFFARDPQARDRLGRGRAPAPPSVREASPPEPERCVVRPPTGASTYRLLGGELLDAPCGLRIATTAQKVGGRVELAVAPAGFDALGAIEGRVRRDPVLRGPVLVPSRARASLLEGLQPGPVGVLLEALADPTLFEFQRLRRELARVEPEARELERRLRPSLEDERGLRAVGISVRGTARSVDVFASARDLSEALPKLLRAALLEAALDAPAAADDDLAMGADPRTTKLTTGVKDTRERHQALIAALARCRRTAGAGAFKLGGGAEVAAIWVAGDDLLHAASLSRP